MAKIRTDDNVIVISGKDKGKTGKVIRVEPANQRVYVEGLNMIKRHQRPVPGRPNLQVGVDRAGRRRSTSPTWRSWIRRTTSRRVWV